VEEAIFIQNSSSTSLSGRCPALLSGQHNRAIAERVGFGASDIDATERDGVLHLEPQA
jgi:hypothetical protein